MLTCLSCERGRWCWARSDPSKICRLSCVISNGRFEVNSLTIPVSFPSRGSGKVSLVKHNKSRVSLDSGDTRTLLRLADGGRRRPSQTE